MENETPAERTPIWVPIVRAMQAVLALIILALSAYLIHGKYFNTLGFTIFLSLLTWIVVAYNLATLYVPAAKAFRIQFVSLGADAALAVFWLSAMGSTAALRASFKYAVDILGCYNDGSAINSSTCIIARDLAKRAAVANANGLAMMSAIAGLSALQMLLFIACVVLGALTWNKSRSRTSQAAYAPQKQNEGSSYQMATPQQPYAAEPQPGIQQQQVYTQQQTYAQQPYAPPAPGHQEMPAQQQQYHPN
ncbi:hypothetical protein BGZ60DRAFT_526421 [Tricladium varicosporioides]|nr:hypothetical protein BGZ60DRAFT_526421 [Hymenoscyphus varicosporioides]